MTSTPHARILLSAVSSEFRSYRDALRNNLERPNVTVKVQEQFVATGTETIDKLDDYIQACDAIIHLVGDMAGSWISRSAAVVLQARYPDLAERLPVLRKELEAGTPMLSYTQWEAYLALYHGKILIVATPEPAAPRDPSFCTDETQQAAQQAHLERLRSLGRYPEIFFTNADHLAVGILRSKLQEVIARVSRQSKPIALPYPSLESMFRGREESLRGMRARLGSPSAEVAATVKSIAIHGLGGVGKTRLAVEYAWKFAAGYAALLLVTADRPESLHRNLAGLCEPRALDLPEHKGTEHEVREAAVVRWLQEHPCWLLILDNIDTEEAAAAAERLLAELCGGHVVLTGRMANWSAGVQALELDLLEADAAAEFILARTQGRRRGSSDDDAQARVLAKELGRLTLALEQASAYIAYHSLGLDTYLIEWQERRDQLLAWHDERLMKYPRGVVATLQVSLNHLTEPTRQLLNRLAWLAPEPIPETLLGVPVLKSDGEDTHALLLPIGTKPGDALAELATYSLITRASDQTTFSIHPLVQASIRQSQNTAAEASPLAEMLGWMDGVFSGDPSDVRYWKTLNPLIPHVRSTIGHADKCGITSPTTLLMNRLGDLLMAQALHRQAEPLFRRALLLDEQCFGPSHVDVANHLSSLGQCLMATEHWDEAETLLRRAWAIDEQNHGPQHPSVAADLNNLGQLLKATNHLQEAEPLLRRALAINEEAYGPEHSTVARNLSNLGLLLQALNSLEESESLLCRALAIEEHTHGPGHPNVARVLNNLASVLHSANRLEEAERLLRRALSIEEAAHDSDVPVIAVVLHNLARLLKDRGLFSEAESLIRRALRIDESAYGPHHSAVSRDLLCLAGLLQATTRLKEAEFLLRRALAIDEGSYGPGHTRVAIDLNDLGLLLLEMNRTAEAEPLMRSAVATLEYSYGSDHPDVACCLIGLARLLGETHRLEEAEAVTRRALLVFERSYGAFHPKVSACLSVLVVLLREANRLEEAEVLSRRSLAIVEKCSGPDHPDVARDLNNLALLLRATGRLSEAESALRRSLGIFEQCYGPSHPMVANCLSNIAAVLQDSGRLAEAEPIGRRALTMAEQSYGPSHPQVALSLNNLGTLLCALDRLGEAEPLLCRALAILVTEVGTDDPHAQLLRENLGYLQQRLAESRRRGARR